MKLKTGVKVLLASTIIGSGFLTLGSCRQNLVTTTSPTTYHTTTYHTTVTTTTGGLVTTPIP